MARSERFRKIGSIYLLFLALLFARLYADWRRFPVDGFVDPTPVAVLEAAGFYVFLHYAFCFLFLKNGVSQEKSLLLGTVAAALYMFTHFLEYFFYMGGRASVYAPVDNFIVNIFTAFILTGDAGFWQIMRMPVCCVFIFAALRRCGKPTKNIVASLILFYLFGMVLVHHELWRFLPQKPQDIPLELAEAGIFSAISASYGMLGLAIVALADPGSSHGLRCLQVRERFGYLARWISAYLALSLFLPCWLAQIDVSLLFLLVISVVIVRIALFPVAAETGSSSNALTIPFEPTASLLPRLAAGAIAAAISALLFPAAWAFLALLCATAAFELVIGRKRTGRFAGKNLALPSAALFFTAHFFILQL